MKALLTVLSFLLLGNIGLSQFVETFESFDTNVWKGDTHDFSIHPDGKLQLNADTAGVSLLYTALPFNNLTDWAIDISLGFPPSNNNQLTLFLASADSTFEQTAYGLRIGQSGDQDVLQFFLIEAGEETIMAEGQMTLNEGGDFRLVVHRELENWAIGFEKDGTQMEDLQVSYQHSDIQNLSFFGLRIEYTVSRRDKFSFDNLTIDAGIDTIPPQIIENLILDPQLISLQFNEPIDTSDLKKENFEINPPISVSRIEVINSETTILLHLEIPLFPGSYQLMVSGVTDLAGNPITQSIELIYNGSEFVLPFELLITEIFADPTPSFGLPEAEYLEILNPTDHPVNLANIVLRFRSSEVNLPMQDLEAFEYIILCSDQDSDLFDPYGDVIPIPNFPRLRNSDDTISLIEKSSLQLIHQVAYNINWYRDDEKADGGYSLEMINPDYPCLTSENWTASKDEQGGTPGSANSVIDPSLAASDIQLIAYHYDADILRLIFNRYLTGTSVSVTGEGQNGPWEVLKDAQKAEALFQLGGVSPVQLEINLIDCKNQSYTKLIEVGQPRLPLQGDLLINELMFNTKDNQQEYIELINASTDFLQLDLLNIGYNTRITPLSFLKTMPPGEIIAFSNNPDRLHQQFLQAPRSQLLTLDLPTLANSEGTVSVIWKNDAGEEITIDALDYSEDLHDPRVSNPKGVAIERISTKENTQNKQNWQSAAFNVGYGTPGYKNSQTSLSPTMSESFHLVNDRFSPNGDGFEDELIISYQLEDADFLGRIDIFDSGGRPVNVLINNVLLGKEGLIKWNGTGTNGISMNRGVYILRIEIHNTSGTRKVFKKQCVLATNNRL